MQVMPAPGLKVRDPRNPTRLFVLGESVDETDLEIHRLIACGDLLPCTDDDIAAAKAEAKADPAPAPQLAPPAPPAAPTPAAPVAAPAAPASAAPQAKTEG